MLKGCLSGLLRRSFASPFLPLVISLSEASFTIQSGGGGEEEEKKACRVVGAEGGADLIWERRNERTKRSGGCGIRPRALTPKSLLEG